MALNSVFRLKILYSQELPMLSGTIDSELDFKIPQNNPKYFMFHKLLAIFSLYMLFLFLIFINMLILYVALIIIYILVLHI